MAEYSEEEKKARKACGFKHTKYQPTEAEFRCPKCDAKAGDFCVEESPNYDCPDLHDEDELICYGAGTRAGCPSRYYISGKAFAAACVKKNSLVLCEHCKGKGFVPTKK